MIEVIYDRKNSGQEEKVKEKQTNEVKLPKNIRQIGLPPENKKIYIEDYVVSYLNYIGRPNCVQARGAVLLGKIEETKEGRAIFINGAVDAPNLEFDMDESEFTKEAWSEIYEDIKKYFPDMEIVGWFLSRMGFSTAINKKIEKLHVENFPGRDRVLYVTDSLECEDAFYIFQRGQMVKQTGYYVYYSRNEEMQNYIIKQKGGKPEESESEIQRKDTELIRMFRDKNESVSEEKTVRTNLAYIASSFVVVAVLALGISVINSRDKMQDMEVSINRLELTADTEKKDGSPDAEPVAGPVSVEDVTSEQVASTEITTENTEAPKETTEAAEATTAVPVEEATVSTEQTLPAISDGNVRYHIVEKGESLTGISCMYYGTPSYAEKIAKANGIEVDDTIYEGAEIIIPEIE